MGIVFKLNTNFKNKEVKGKVEAGGKRAMVVVGQYLLEESVKTVPYRDGILEASGTASTDGKTVCVSFNTPYARRLHEHPEYNFRGKGRGKWLERTFNDKVVQSNAMKIIKGEIDI